VYQGKQKTEEEILAMKKRINKDIERSELRKLTSQPKDDDEILFCIPVCAPWRTMN